MPLHLDSRAEQYAGVKIQKPREIAYRLLGRISTDGPFVETVLDREFESTRLDSRDRALVQELVLGVVRWQSTLDWLIDRKTADRPQRPGVRTLLRLGLYQLFWLDRVPDHAAVNETVALARQSGLVHQAAFINALLRGYTRERESTRTLLDDLKRTDPATAWSHPRWLVDRWLQHWGTDPTLELLAWNNTPPPLFARANPLAAHPAQLLARWREEDVEYDFGSWDWIPENLVFRLKASPPLAKLGSFRDGWFYVQDPSTLLAVQQLDPQPGERILDLCAAPGGKTTLIAQQINNQGELVATDSTPERLQLLRANCTRLKVDCAAFAVATSLTSGGSRTAPFDRILVDAPCSNTGVMRRRVGLRWRLQPEELGRLRSLQGELVRTGLRFLKPGGRLVYSTCSLEPEENHTLIQALLAEHPEVRLLRERQLLPGSDRVDGAYVATLTTARAPAPANA